MREPMFDFVPATFFRMLAVVFSLILVGWIVAITKYGELTRVDMVGSVISGLILAYLVHLWIIYARDDWHRE